MKSYTRKSIFLVLYLLFLYMILSEGIVSIAYGAEIADKQSIKIIQATLNAEGYDCGTADGIAGKRTKAAIEKYQQENGMAVTGIITDELTNSLGLTSEMLKGVLISDFITRYNDAVSYCNKISDETGDPDIGQIGEEILDRQISILDDNVSISFLVDDRKISVRGIILYEPGNSYNIPFVYEMISSVYALDTSFTDIASVISFVGDFVEDHSATSGKMDYSIVTRDGVIYFTAVPTPQRLEKNND